MAILKDRAFLGVVVSLLLLLTAEAWSAEPRFFGIRTSLTAPGDVLIAYDADGQPVSTSSLGELTGLRLVSNDSHLFTIGSTDATGAAIYRMAINNAGGFEWFSGYDNRRLDYFETGENGNFYQANVPSNHAAIKRFDSSGQQLSETVLVDIWYEWLLGFDLDADGDIYAIRERPSWDPGPGNASLRRYSPSGTFISDAIIPFAFAWLVTIDELNQRLYLGDQQGSIGVYDISQQQPELIDTWVLPGMSVLLDMSFDSLTGHVLVAGIGGILEVDADGSSLIRNSDFGTFYTGVTALPFPSGMGADFNGDGDLDQVDLDAMSRAVTAGADPLAFDLSGDGLVTNADLDAWMAIASSQNLPSGQTYQPGDANLDGFVDGGDFSVWNQNKFTRLAAWSKGDFNGDGFIDGQDFIVWNKNKSITGASLVVGNSSAVPEPISCAIWFTGGFLHIRQHRRRRGCRKAGHAKESL